MICDCCRRDVEYVKASFWHGDAKICRECFAQWYDPDNGSIQLHRCDDHWKLCPPQAWSSAAFGGDSFSGAYAILSSLRHSSLPRPRRGGTVLANAGACQRPRRMLDL